MAKIIAGLFVVAACVLGAFWLTRSSVLEEDALLLPLEENPERAFALLAHGGDFRIRVLRPTSSEGAKPLKEDQSIRTHSRLTGPELEAQARGLLITIRSYTKDLDDLMSKASGTTEELLEMATIQRRIATRKAQLQMLQAGYYLVMDECDAMKLENALYNNKSAFMSEMSWGTRYVHTRKGRDGQSLAVIFPMWLRSYPEVLEARGEEERMTGAKWQDARTRFNSLDKEARENTYREIRRLQKTMRDRSLTALERLRAFQEWRGLLPPGTVVDETTMTMLERPGRR